jgi:N-formylglutamate amidohydrolase
VKEDIDHRVLRQIIPEGTWLPLVFDVPHCGREHPSDFGSVLPEATLRYGEDAYIDELLADAPKLEIPILAARFPRTYIDPNRAPEDINPELLSEAWPGTGIGLEQWAEVGVHSLQPSIKSVRGIGLIWQEFAPGGKLYDRQLAPEEVIRRLQKCYHPYHQTLASWLRSLRATFNSVWHVNWHSMKSRGNKHTPDKPGNLRPHIVIGDLYGTACEPEFTELVQETLKGLGYDTSLNDPYAGAWVLKHHSSPEQGIHSLQIEIRRDLYMDENTLECHEGFNRLQNDLNDLMKAMRKYVNHQLKRKTKKTEKS